MPSKTRSASRPRSLVTGGAGFIGSHLCERLLAAGHEVICVDSLKQRRPDISPATDWLGWRPRRSGGRESNVFRTSNPWCKPKPGAS